MAISARRAKARESKRNAILRAARSLFLAKGFSDVTVDSIAKRVDISKGAVYLHFESKDEIYVKVLLGEIEGFYRRVENIPTMAGSADEALRLFANAYVDFFMKEREVYRIFMEFIIYLDKKPRHHEALYQLVTRMNKAMDVISTIFEYGIARGEFVANIDKKKTQDAIWGMLNGVLSLYVFVARKEESRATLRPVINSGLDSFMNGIKKR